VTATLNARNTVRHPLEHHIWTPGVERETSRQNVSGDSKGATEFHKACFGNHNCFSVDGEGFVTCRAIDVVRFQQFSYKKSSSLPRKAALSADVLLRQQAVPESSGLLVHWGEPAVKYIISLIKNAHIVRKIHRATTTADMWRDSGDISAVQCGNTQMHAVQCYRTRKASSLCAALNTWGETADRRSNPRLR